MLAQVRFSTIKLPRIGNNEHLHSFPRRGETNFLPGNNKQGELMMMVKKERERGWSGSAQPEDWDLGEARSPSHQSLMNTTCKLEEKLRATKQPRYGIVMAGLLFTLLEQLHGLSGPYGRDGRALPKGIEIVVQQRGGTHEDGVEGSFLIGWVVGTRSVPCVRRSSQVPWLAGSRIALISFLGLPPQSGYYFSTDRVPRYVLEIRKATTKQVRHQLVGRTYTLHTYLRS